MGNEISRYVNRPPPGTPSEGYHTYIVENDSRRHIWAQWLATSGLALSFHSYKSLRGELIATPLAVGENPLTQLVLT